MCKGRFVTGPVNNSWSPLAVTIALIAGSAIDTFILVAEIKNKQYGAWTIPLFALGLFLTLWTLLVQLMATYSDPGIVTPKESLHSREDYARALDLDPAEKDQWEKDQISQDCMFYL